MIRSLGIVRDRHRKTLLVVTTAKKILLHCSWFPKEISNATIEGNSDPAKMKLGGQAWPSVFTQPNITHSEEKNRRSDFQKIICVKGK